jgi:hypothetical protein
MLGLKMLNDLLQGIWSRTIDAMNALRHWTLQLGGQAFVECFIPPLSSLQHAILAEPLTEGMASQKHHRVGDPLDMPEGRHHAYDHDNRSDRRPCELSRRQEQFFCSRMRG